MAAAFLAQVGIVLSFMVSQLEKLVVIGRADRRAYIALGCAAVSWHGMSLAPVMKVMKLPSEDANAALRVPRVCRVRTCIDGAAHAAADASRGQVSGHPPPQSWQRRRAHPLC